MSINALVTGKLFADPELRTGSSGKAYTRATLLAHDGDADSFVSVIAFGSVGEQLAALSKGDAASVSGRAKVKTWERNGETRVGLSVVADCLLTLHHVRRKRQAMTQAESDACELGCALTDASSEHVTTDGNRSRLVTLAVRTRRPETYRLRDDETGQTWRATREGAWRPVAAGARDCAEGA